MTDDSVVHNDYCWRCISKAQDLERLAVQMLPAALAEENDRPKVNGEFLLESVVERAVYAAQLLKEKCLSETAKESQE